VTRLQRVKDKCRNAHVRPRAGLPAHNNDYVISMLRRIESLLGNDSEISRYTLASRTFPIDSLAHDSELNTQRIRLSEGISKYQQLKKKSADTALNTVLASAQIQMT
jgi:hypothetical protein